MARLARHGRGDGLGRRHHARRGAAHVLLDRDGRARPQAHRPDGARTPGVPRLSRPAHAFACRRAVREAAIALHGLDPQADARRHAQPERRDGGGDSRDDRRRRGVGRDRDGRARHGAQRLQARRPSGGLADDAEGRHRLDRPRGLARGQHREDPLLEAFAASRLRRQS